MANEIQMGVAAQGEVNDSKGKTVKKIKTKAKRKRKTKRSEKLNTSKYEIKYTQKKAQQMNIYLFK